MSDRSIVQHTLSGHTAECCTVRQRCPYALQHYLTLVSVSILGDVMKLLVSSLFNFQCTLSKRKLGQASRKLTVGAMHAQAITKKPCTALRQMAAMQRPPYAGAVGGPPAASTLVEPDAAALDAGRPGTPQSQQQQAQVAQPPAPPPPADPRALALGMLIAQSVTAAAGSDALRATAEEHGEGDAETCAAVSRTLGCRRLSAPACVPVLQKHNWTLQDVKLLELPD